MADARHDPLISSLSAPGQVSGLSGELHTIVRAAGSAVQQTSILSDPCSAGRCDETVRRLPAKAPVFSKNSPGGVPRLHFPKPVPGVGATRDLVEIASTSTGRRPLLAAIRADRLNLRWRAWGN